MCSFFHENTIATLYQIKIKFRFPCKQLPFHISQLIPFCVARIIALKYITIFPFLWCFYYQYIFVLLALVFECCLFFFPYRYLFFSTCGPFSYFRAVERSSAELSWNSSADLRKSRAVYTHRKKSKTSSPFAPGHKNGVNT